jgi:hypothetical protein
MDDEVMIRVIDMSPPANGTILILRMMVEMHGVISFDEKRGQRSASETNGRSSHSFSRSQASSCGSLACTVSRPDESVPTHSMCSPSPLRRSR